MTASIILIGTQDENQTSIYMIMYSLNITLVTSTSQVYTQHWGYKDVHNMVSSFFLLEAHVQ